MQAVHRHGQLPRPPPLPPCRPLPCCYVASWAAAVARLDRCAALVVQLNAINREEARVGACQLALRALHGLQRQEVWGGSVERRLGGQLFAIGSARWELRKPSEPQVGRQLQQAARR